MPEQQTELKMFEADPADPNVGWLERLLESSGSWMSAADICRAANLQPTDDNKRYVRELAGASDCVLSGPGSPGYKHLAVCTPEEIRHYTNAGIAQAKVMVKRMIRIRRNAHAILG